MNIFWILGGALAVVLVLYVYQRSGRAALRGVRRELHDLQNEEDRVFDFLHGIGAAFSEGVRSSELHRLIVESALRILDARHGALYVTNKSDTQLLPAFLAPGGPAFVPVPPEILEQTSRHPATLESFLQLHPVGLAAPGLLAECWKSGSVRLIPAGGDDRLPGHAALLGPLIYRHRVIGVLALANPVGMPPFEEKDLKVFRTIAEQSAFALYNEAVYLEAGEKRLLDRDLAMARDVQRILLPESDPDFPGFELHAISLAARHLSGDYFDYIDLGEGRLGVAIADVSGKGVPASLIMAMCRTVLRREAPDCQSPSEALRRVNHQLYPDIKEDMFVSMAYLILEPGGRISMARAGHDAPILQRAATGELEKLTPKGMALGIDSGDVFNRVCADFTFHMESGDCLLLYTDGATEAVNPEGTEFGIERLMEALRESAGSGAPEVVARVAGAVQQFTGQNLKHDDFTLIALRKS